MQVDGEPMENLTLISVHASYLLALGLFVAVLAGRFMLASKPVPIGPPTLPKGKVPGWFYAPTDLLGVLVFFLIYYGFAYMGATAEKVEGNPYTAEALLFGIGIQVFMPAMALAIVVGRVSPIEWLGLRWKDWVQVFGIAPLSVFLMFAFSITLYSLGYNDMLVALGVAEEQQAVTMFREGQDPVVLAMIVFAAVIVAPVCEEVIFRGYLYPVAKKYAHPTVAALFSALVFAAAHGNVAALVPLFVFGLVLVAVYEYTGSIWAPIAVHFLFNGSTVVIQFLARLYPEMIAK